MAPTIKQVQENISQLLIQQDNCKTIQAYKKQKYLKRVSFIV